MPLASGPRPRSVLDEALALAEPGGFIRIFVDEGAPMARLLREASSRGVRPEYVRRLLAAFPVDDADGPHHPRRESPEAVSPNPSAAASSKCSLSSPGG